MASVGVGLNAQLGAGFWGLALHFIFEPAFLNAQRDSRRPRPGRELNHRNDPMTTHAPIAIAYP